MKHYRIEITPTAREGLLEIGEYIALDNPTRAITFIDEITDSLQKNLSIFPYSGKVADDVEVDQEIRMWSHGNYISYYRVVEEKQLVEVLYVFNTSRDMQSLIMKL
jgi:toxin ParE1/3/4